MRKRSWIIGFLASSSLPAGVMMSVAVAAQEVGNADARFRLGEMLVVGQSAGDFSTAPGAAQRISEETLERDEPDNIHRVLNDVPGVYIRGEEGFGNRPNIGIRGTTTERSQKINIMVDGVLAAPAPYSAPAAYYFPQVSRMEGVEVVKGPAAITEGPATVGGSLNLVTRSIPSEASGGLDLGAGEDGYRKAHGHYGASSENAGFLVEGIRTESDGFKDLDGGGDTGFEKNDFMVKGRLNTDPGAEVYHQLDLTLEYADEESDETYLGLAENDFDDTPFRRYAASRNGLFEWEYKKTQLNHLVEFGRNLSVNTTAYYQDFERAWTKFREFDADRPTLEILRNPNSGRNPDFLDVLRGERDSDPVAGESLLIETNDRNFFSRGIQSELKWRTRTGSVGHDVLVGVRFHQDEVERDHTDNSFQMRDGNLERDDTPTRQTILERETADAFSFFMQDEMQWGKLRVTPGVRVETVDYLSKSRLTGEKQSSDNVQVLPALGVFYQLRPSLGLLAGVHRGYVPTGPGVSDQVDPEESINYEAGVRYASGPTSAEVIGFFNDYSNLLANCTISTGCAQITDAFEGGDVDIYGFESRIEHQWQYRGFQFPASLAYTFTESEFKSDFRSEFPLWADVSEGDRLPYMPRHKVGVNAGVKTSSWNSTAQVSYVSDQDEQSGDQFGNVGLLEGAEVGSHVVVDLKNNWTFMEGQTLYVHVDNVFDNEYLLSRRPLGARPGKSRTVKAGYKLSF